MSDIVERLRATGGKGQGGPLKAEAADEIERLRERCEAYKGQVEAGAAEIERLRQRCGALDALERAGQAEIDKLRAQVEQQQWKPIETAPRDGSMIELWHRVWECPMTVQWKIGFISDLPWIEKTKTTAWPTEAFTHWRHTASAPLPSTERTNG